MKTLAIIIFALIAQSLYSQGWVLKITGTSNDLIDVHFLDVSTGYAVGQTGTILKTTNGGDNWVSQVSGTANQLNSVRFFNASTGYTAGNTGTILKTTNGGTNWVAQTSGTTEHLFDMSMIDASTIYLAKNFSLTSSVLRTVNGGTNWTSQGITGSFNSIYFPSASTGYVVGSTSAGNRTTNSGANWIAMSFPVAGNYRSVFFTSETTGYCAGQLGAGTSPLMMKTTNAGVNWVDQPTGQAQYLNAVYFPNTLTGYACGRVGLMIKTTSGGTTGINTLSELSNSYHLSQNYPNPFNPETKIRFSIPKSAFVTLVVYDVTGKSVNSLVNDNLNPGVYEVDFSPNHICSGVYFYKLVTTGFTDTKKMLLIK